MAWKVIVFGFTKQVELLYVAGAPIAVTLIAYFYFMLKTPSVLLHFNFNKNSRGIICRDKTRVTESTLPTCRG